MLHILHMTYEFLLLLPLYILSVSYHLWLLYIELFYPLLTIFRYFYNMSYVIYINICSSLTYELLKVESSTSVESNVIIQTHLWNFSYSSTDSTLLRDPLKS